MTAPAMDGVGSTKAMCEADSQKALAADADVSMATVTADLLRPDNICCGLGPSYDGLFLLIPGQRRQPSAAKLSQVGPNPHTS